MLLLFRKGDPGEEKERYNPIPAVDSAVGWMGGHTEEEGE